MGDDVTVKFPVIYAFPVRLVIPDDVKPLAFTIPLFDVKAPVKLHPPPDTTNPFEVFIPPVKLTPVVVTFQAVGDDVTVKFPVKFVSPPDMIPLAFTMPPVILQPPSDTINETICNSS